MYGVLGVACIAWKMEMSESVNMFTRRSEARGPDWMSQIDFPHKYAEYAWKCASYFESWSLISHERNAAVAIAMPIPMTHTLARKRKRIIAYKQHGRRQMKEKENYYNLPFLFENPHAIYNWRKFIVFPLFHVFLCLQSVSECGYLVFQAHNSNRFTFLYIIFALLK